MTESTEKQRPGHEGRFHGLRTCIYTTDDMTAAKAWYADAFGVAPYFDEPFYIGFEIGGFELGLTPRQEGGPVGPGGVETYWGTDDVASMADRLVSMGATPHTPPKDVGDGIIVATVLDPWGNIFGMIHNPHFKG